MAAKVAETAVIMMQDRTRRACGLRLGRRAPDDYATEMIADLVDRTAAPARRSTSLAGWRKGCISIS